VKSDHKTADGKLGDLNGTVIPAIYSTVNPSLSSVYEIQFKVMQENMGVMENQSEVLNKTKMNEQYGIEKAIILKNSGDIEVMPVVCASGTGEPMQIQINIPLQSPNHILHDIITHNVIPIYLQNTMAEQTQFEEEGDDESTAGNFNDVAKEVGLSPRVNEKSGRKSKKTNAKQISSTT